MKRIYQLIASLVTVAAVTLAPEASHASRAQKQLPDFTVFIDLPTGFVFVKFPQGWKFVGAVQVDSTDLSTANVVTELLQGDDGDDARRVSVVGATR